MLYSVRMGLPIFARVTSWSLEIGNVNDFSLWNIYQIGEPSDNSSTKTDSLKTVEAHEKMSYRHRILSSHDTLLFVNNQ